MSAERANDGRIDQADERGKDVDRPSPEDRHTASGVVKAVGDRLDNEAKAAKGKARTVVATAAGVLKAASAQLDNEAKALTPPAKKTVKVPANKAVKAPTRKAAKAPT